MRAADGPREPPARRTARRSRRRWIVRLSVVAMRGVDHQFQRRIDDRAGLLGIEIPHQFRRALDVREQCRTVLRSPSIEEASACSAAKRIAGVETATAGGLSEPSGVFSGVAHSPQNFAVGAFSKPHLPHLRPNGAAHSLQNLRPAGFSDPHCEQRINAPREPDDRLLLYHPASATNQQAADG